jgi:hypothetical protein
MELRVDWALVERLAPHLAWPTVALLMFLLALIVLGRKLVTVAESLIALRKLPEVLGEISMRFNEGASKMSSQTSSLVSVLQELPDRLSALAEQMRSVRAEIEQKNIKDDTDTIEKLTPHQAGAQHAMPVLSLEEMHRTAITRWNELQALIELKLRRSGLEGDLRRIGAAAFLLTKDSVDKPLSRDDAQLISALFTTYRRFVSGGRNIEEWLTPDIYESFVRGVEAAKVTISQSL